MREIREVIFRGKRTDNGEWIEGDLKQAFRGNQLSSCGIMKTPTAYCWRVDPETVGQYTGLTDKNGVRIFEGDIVRYDVNYHDMVISYDVENWGGWLYEDMDDNMQAYSIYEFCLKDIAVVGNIHDNPELLREASKPIAQDVLASATDEGKDYIMGFTLMQG